MISTEEIIKVASYFSIIAHAPGRLRVRVNPKIKNESGTISIDDIEDLPNKINGIKSIKVKKIIASVTILYSPDIFPPELWEDLVQNRNLEELTQLINSLAKKVS
ncbi:MAG: hypothetical protein C0625_11490 [Arcobacter sp.]|nr:MAG: hypothetical protein C0625_11490 [Arcobacter sp.]